MAHGGNEHPIPNEVDRPSNLLIGGLVVFFVAVLLVVLVAVDSLVTVTFQAAYEEKVYSTENPALRELRAAEAAKLSDYAWADQEARTVRLPVDEALELTLRDWPARVAAAAAAVAEEEVRLREGLPPAGR